MPFVDPFAVSPASLVEFNGFGNNSTDNSTIFAAWVNSGNRDLYLGPGTYVLSSNVTVPATVRIRFANGALLAPASGVVITFESLSSIDAGEIVIVA